MKGYAVESGYMGYVNGEYMLFASETDYTDYMENQQQFVSVVYKGTFSAFSRFCR